MEIRFLGATKTVTGSCYIIETEDFKILLDCGQYQGNKKIEALNHDRFEFDPLEIDYMFLSHAHIDHSGRIPLLVKKGFDGDIYCTKATYDLAEILLKDSGYIHEKEADWENKKRIRAGRETIEPLYTFEDAVAAIPQFKAVLYEQKIVVNDNLTVRFNDAGHILGSSIIELWITEEGKTHKLVFSGDLGMSDKPILKDPALIESADYLIMESTYGGRLHEETDNRIDLLMDIILDTIDRNGTVIIPAFAVGRTQEMIYELNKYYEYNKKAQEKLDDIFVYIDSPLATNATEIFKKNANNFDEETRNYILSGDNPLDFKNLKFTKSVEESRALNANRQPKIIISASGMCNAGRIKHHLKHNLWNPDNAIVFVGYQAQGTLGRRILDGEKDVKIFGESIHINARIKAIDGFSGHADQNQLINWLHGFKKWPEHVFLVHGEDDSKIEFAKKIKDTFGKEVIIAQENQPYQLDAGIKIEQEEHKPVKYEKLTNIDERLHDLRDSFEAILYETRLKLNKDMDEEEYNQIKNKIIEMERDLANLGILIGD